MKSQKLLSLLIVLGLTSCCLMFCGFTFFKKKAETTQKTVQITQNYSTVQNDLWCVTFQLVWNELMDKFNNGNPVKFVGGNPPIADELNKQFYTSEVLSDDSYYTVFGKVSNKLRKNIEKTVYKKFKEKSDILDMFDWSAKDSYIAYSMLKKNFAFWIPFDRLASSSFNNSTETVKYFGIDKKSNKKLTENVTVLFYNSPDEYAISLATNEREDVILYRTDKKDTFANHFSFIENNTYYGSLSADDELKVPDISVDKTISYDDLCSKQIEGTDYVISQAVQTIKFKMDNKGGSLKSEAAIGIMKTSLIHPDKNARKFYFNKPFILFLIENGKDKPYFAMNISNTDYLVKE